FSVSGTSRSTICGCTAFLHAPAASRSSAAPRLELRGNPHLDAAPGVQREFLVAAEIVAVRAVEGVAQPAIQVEQPCAEMQVGAALEAEQDVPVGRDLEGRRALPRDHVARRPVLAG